MWLALVQCSSPRPGLTGMAVRQQVRFSNDPADCLSTDMRTSTFPILQTIGCARLSRPRATYKQLLERVPPASLERADWPHRPNWTSPAECGWMLLETSFLPIR